MSGKQPYNFSDDQSKSQLPYLSSNSFCSLPELLTFPEICKCLPTENCEKTAVVLGYCPCLHRYFIIMFTQTIIVCPAVTVKLCTVFMWHKGNKILVYSQEWKNTRSDKQSFTEEAVNITSLLLKASL